MESRGMLIKPLFLGSVTFSPSELCLFRGTGCSSASASPPRGRALLGALLSQAQKVLLLSQIPAGSKSNTSPEITERSAFPSHGVRVSTHIIYFLNHGNLNSCQLRVWFHLLLVAEVIPSSCFGLSESKAGTLPWAVVMSGVSEEISWGVWPGFFFTK